MIQDERRDESREGASERFRFDRVGFGLGRRRELWQGSRVPP